MQRFVQRMVALVLISAVILSAGADSSAAQPAPRPVTSRL